MSALEETGFSLLLYLMHQLKISKMTDKVMSESTL